MWQGNFLHVYSSVYKVAEIHYRRTVCAVCLLQILPTIMTNFALKLLIKQLEGYQAFLELTSNLCFFMCKLSLSQVCCLLTAYYIKTIVSNAFSGNCTSCPTGTKFWFGQGPLQAEPINNLLTPNLLSFSLSSGSFVKVTSISSYFLYKYINTRSHTQMHTHTRTCIPWPGADDMCCCGGETLTPLFQGPKFIWTAQGDGS